MIVILIVLIAYLFGSIPFGVLVAKGYRIDIQKVGRGNIGATNVLRATGWGPALFVVFADMFKGGLMVLFARALGLPEWAAALSGFAAVLGHNHSVFLKFKGGKGVATSFGMVLLMNPVLAIAFLSVGIATILVTRFVSAGSIIGAFSGLIMAISWQRPVFELLIYAALVAMIVLKHRDNLARMYMGIERRIDEQGMRTSITTATGKKHTRGEPGHTSQLMTGTEGPQKNDSLLN